MPLAVGNAVGDASTTLSSAVGDASTTLSSAVGDASTTLSGATLARIPTEWGIIASSKLAGAKIVCPEKPILDTNASRQFPGVKRRKRGMSNTPHDNKRVNGKKAEDASHSDNLAGVAHSIMIELNKTHIRSDLPCAEFDIEYTLSKVPYREMLRDLMGNTDLLNIPDIPVVLRAYEESFMREATEKGERQCVMGSECECMKVDLCNPFRGVEFLLPGEAEQEQVQMCVLCHRRFVQTLFHDVVYSGKSYQGVVQKYGSICGQPGEYAKEVMLICPLGGPTHCFPFPAVSHQRNKYTVLDVRGCKRLLQHNMSQKDFC